MKQAMGMMNDPATMKTVTKHQTADSRQQIADSR
jgi:hypothetical protein